MLDGEKHNIFRSHEAVQLTYQCQVWHVLCGFDGYGKHTTKEHEHRRRQVGKVSASIIITEIMQVHTDQKAFFSNKQNKSTFINLIANHLPHSVKISSCGADTLIESIALEFARHGQPVTIVAEDTDILIMMLHHILFIHTWRGCDTTSATYGHGKMHLMKLFKKF